MDASRPGFLRFQELCESWLSVVGRIVANFGVFVRA
jgi:hypothetical protein